MSARKTEPDIAVKLLEGLASRLRKGSLTAVE